MFYKSKVDFYILDAGKHTQNDPGQFADAYGRAYGKLRKEKKELITRLKKNGCSPLETAAVLALWLAQNTDEDRNGYPIKKALDDVHTKLFSNKRLYPNAKDDPHGTRRHTTIYKMLKEEGIEPTEVSYA